MKTLIYFLYVWLIFIVGCAVLWLSFSVILPVAIHFIIDHTFIMPPAERIVRGGEYWILFVSGITSFSYVAIQFLQAKDDELTVYEKTKYIIFFIAVIVAYAYFGVKFSHLLGDKILSYVQSHW